MAESIGRTREALPLFLEAVDHNPRPDYCAHTAELLVELTDDTHRAVELAEIAVRGEPHNLDYLLLLGRICRQVSRIKKAQSSYERVLALEPKHEEAKKAVRALKRM
jgi:cytochrome c-type biogenesis protein CcmH/NrfG